MESKYHIEYSYVSSPVGYKETELVQLGRLYCKPQTLIKKHVHLNWYELTVVTEGEGIVTTNDTPLKVKKGDIYISFPGDFHEIVSSKDNPLKYDFFSFDTKNSRVKTALKEISSNMFNYEQRIFQSEQITTAVSNAIAELSSKQKYCEDILSAIFEQILFHIIRSFEFKNISISTKHIAATDELCFQIMHYIDTHIYTMESLSVLSESFNYNYSYLSDMFKKNTGGTIVNYYHNRRLDSSKLLIDEGKLSISKIADMLNYSSLYSFSKAFKNKYGISPKKYSNRK